MAFAYGRGGSGVVRRAGGRGESWFIGSEDCRGRSSWHRPFDRHRQVERRQLDARALRIAGESRATRREYSAPRAYQRPFSGSPTTSYLQPTLCSEHGEGSSISARDFSLRNDAPRELVGSEW